jgi:DNA-binding NtrC family response regulator
MRLGALQPRTIDVRFVSATHRDLEADSERGTYRRDFYFRIAGVTLVIPPLRERLDEVETLARGFVREACERSRRPPVELSRAALAALRAHSWPGNIRELRNVIERAVLLADTTIDPKHLDLDIRRPPEQPLDLRAGVANYERQRIVEALESCQGNQTKAAKLLGISRRTLIERLDELALPRPRKR